MPPNRHTGFTLIELLIVLLLLGILISIALPSFATLLQKNRQTTTLNQLRLALHYARSYAIISRQTVSICSGQTSCIDSRQWSEQLLVFHDSGSNGQIDDDDTVLQQPTLPAGYSWHWSNFRNQPHMSFKSDGTTHSLNGTFTLCHEDQPTQQIVINITGRTRIQTPPTGTSCR